MDWDQIEDEMGHNDDRMNRDRPYGGQPHTDNGARGATEIKGITFRDLRDCYLRAICLSAHHIAPHLYEQADKGEAGLICENDVFGLDFTKLDPMAIQQNLSCEVERLMGIFPNVPELRPRP